MIAQRMGGESNSDLVLRVRQHASAAAFGSSIVQNNLRALVVEAIVDLTLPPGWRWCSQDWAGWDFEHEDGVRLEVKQTAAKQTWAAPVRPSAPRFDIAERRGRWEGSVWIDEPGRHAQLYVFAHHPIADGTAEQRDPLQWVFYLVEAARLPATRTISLRTVQQSADACTFHELGERVERARMNLSRA